MNEVERRVLTALRMDWTPNRFDVWSPPYGHVTELNREVADEVMGAVAKASGASSPIGVVIEGRHGSGKTHLMSWVREQVQQNGYFILMGLAQGRDFWQNLAHCYLRDLRHPARQGRTQLAVFLERLADQIDARQALRAEITGQRPLSRATLDEFVDAVRRTDPELGRDCRNTLRALILFGAKNFSAQDTGEAFLTLQGDTMGAEFDLWGIHAVPKTPQDILEEISRLLAFTGPTVIAADQIDTVFAQARRATGARFAGGLAQTGPSEVEVLAMELGHGLMQLRETVHRTVIVVSCLPATWEYIKENSLDTVGDRFREVRRLTTLPTPAVAQKLIAVRFKPAFDEYRDFRPPYPTWPVLTDAFESAVDLTPRELLARVDGHIRMCLNTGMLDELVDLTRAGESISSMPSITQQQVEALDARFTSLRKGYDVAPALAKETEDHEMADLLEAGLRSWIEEQGADSERFNVFRHAGDSPSVHAMLKESVDASTEDENHWSFRGLAHSHHAAVRTRLERVRNFAALNPAVPARKAFVLRNIGWPGGAVTKQKREEFTELGGEIRKVDEQDLRDFGALKEMWKDNDPALLGWLRSRRPASNTTLLNSILGSVSTAPIDLADLTTQASPETIAIEGEMELGTVVDVGTRIRVPLDSLRKHVVIFAGSGSGKTVLIRRLIEECALQGVSTIALDPNNDLARLGDPWPAPPVGWAPDDESKAREYFTGTDVVVWTPRREAGRPLSLQPLPDFSAVMDDPDEFELALDTAVAALAPRAKVGGTTAKMERGRAVLREALAYFARRRGTGLTGLIDLLAQLPEDVTSLSKAAELADDMSQTLTAAMINDPLFGGSGVPIDPRVLLTPVPGKRARISVISLIGLPTNEQRQSFVNQLQMALFAWIKRNPAGDRPLGALFVMDEAQTLAPSGAMTACTESTLALASQARKYGLGLVFATQAPRGIHNRIVGNAATQFFGFLNSPVQITAAKEMAQAKSSAVLDISRLTAGQFYAVGEGMSFQKLATPMCLSHHPKSALTPEEVLERARTAIT